MSDPAPSSITTSTSRLSARTTKKRALTPVSQQSQQVSALFAHPDREITLPSNSLTKSKPTAAPPEIVTNVQGSSAGAGSGEFHVYKASRRREYERLRLMDEEVAREEADREFEARKEEARRRDEEVLGRNRAKREKAKARKARAKGGGKGGEEEANGEGEGEGDGGPVGGRGGGMKKKLGPRKVGGDNNEEAKDVDGTGDVEGAKEVSQTGGEDEGGITIHDED